MNNESMGQGSSEPKDRLDYESGKLVPISPPSFSPSQSPTPAKSTVQASENPTGEWFGDLIEDLLDGLKVRRLSWPEGECIFFKPVRFSAESQETTDILTLRKADGSEHNWLIARQDLENADDWVAVTEST